MISVVIPTYNREKTIKRSVESVLNQSYEDIEVIVVDDCSTDNTKSVIDSIKDKRLKYFRLAKNSGACAARNEGIKKSNGEYISFQDSDDVWHKNKLEVQYMNLLNNNSDVDICSINVYSENDNALIKTIPNDAMNMKIRKLGAHNALAFGNFVSTQAILCKKGCLIDVMFDTELPRLQDYDLVLRMFKNRKISITSDVLVDLYIQTDSISTSPVKLNKAIDVMLAKRYYDIKKYDDILKATLLKDKGDSYYNTDKKLARKYYRKSLNIRFKLKPFIKLFI